MINPFKFLSKKSLYTLYKEDDFKKDAASKEDRYWKFEQQGELRLRTEDMFDHCILTGSSGTGKTWMQFRMVDQIEKRLKKFKGSRRDKSKMYVLDLAEEFTQRFYEEDNWCIVSPFAKSGYTINIFEGIEHDLHIDNMSNTFIPDEPGAKDKIWVNSSRDLFKALTVMCIHKKETDNKFLAKYIFMSRENVLKELFKVYKEIEELKVKIESELKKSINSDLQKALIRLEKTTKAISAGATHISSETQGQNIWSNFTTNMEFFQHIADDSKQIMSVKKHLRSDKRNVLIPVPIDIEESAKKFASIFFDILSREMLKLDKDKEREVFLFLDEFTNLPKIPSIVKLITLVRKFRVSVILGFQEISRVEEIYGEKLVESFENNTGVGIFFRAKGTKTSEFIQKMVGKQEREISISSNNLGTQEAKDGMNINNQNGEVDTLLTSEIKGLNDLEFIILTKGNSEQTKEGKTISNIGRIQGCIDERFDKQITKSSKTELDDSFFIDSLIDKFKDDSEKKTIDTTSTVLDNLKNEDEDKKALAKAKLLEKIKKKAVEEDKVEEIKKTETKKVEVEKATKMEEEYDPYEDYEEDLDIGQPDTSDSPYS